MHILKDAELTRREMLYRSSQLAVTGTAASYALGLAGIGEASAFVNDGSYKALVCVFLYGGNDHGNTVIPFDPTNHSLYEQIRPSLAIPRASLAATALSHPAEQRLTNDLQFALSPSMPRLKSHFDRGNLAILLNVGPLLAPLTKAQYLSSNTTANPRPSKLFSHNDQQSTWQSFQPEGAPRGWGGRIGDLAMSVNQNAMFTAINATGNAVFLSGQNAFPYRITSRGATTSTAMNSGRLFNSTAAADAMRAIIGTHHQHAFEQDYARMTDRAIKYGGFVNDAFSKAQLSTAFPANNTLAMQLEAVARMIAARNALGVQRQVFLVSLGGFDTHRNQNVNHPGLLSRVDEAVDAFYRATVELGVANSVTTFTASDFGRTLSANGSGTDHGWGGHHFVIGGGVNGGRYYGRAPEVSLTSDDQVGRGRLLPTTSVDEYSTTLALWMGVAPSELSLVAPNVGRFARPDLGFMTRSQ
jgi:uncharacterized protein (DUF1501 family)